MNGGNPSGRAESFTQWGVRRAGAGRVARCRSAIEDHGTARYYPWMAESITQRELRNKSGEIMRRLDQGESFIITRNGVPVGELTPLRRHRFVPTAAVLAVFRNAPAIDPGRFRADVDAWAGQDILPRG